MRGIGSNARKLSFKAMKPRGSHVWEGRPRVFPRPGTPCEQTLDRKYCCIPKYDDEGGLEGMSA